MGSIKEKNIKNRRYYHFDDLIKIKDFNPDLLKMDKKSYKNIDIYYIRYIAMEDFDYVKIHKVNPLYRIIGDTDGRTEKKNGNKYLIFASTYKNKRVLKKYTKLWDKIKDLIKKLND